MSGLLLIVAVVVAMDWVDWAVVGRWLHPHVGVVSGGAGVGFLAPAGCR